MDPIAALDDLLNTWLLNAPTVLEQQAVWTLKCRSKRLLGVAVHPDLLARRIYALLTQSQQQQQAA